jgi:hypothetical protein
VGIRVSSCWLLLLLLTVTVLDGWTGRLEDFFTVF